MGFSGVKRGLKLQTARFRTPGELHTRDLVENDRLDVLYLPIYRGPGPGKRVKTINMMKRQFFLDTKK